MEKIIVSAIDERHIPTRAHETDAGFDVFVSGGTYTIGPKGFMAIRLGVKVAMPNGIICMLLPRSSLFKNYGVLLVNSVGVIDAGYRGEVMMQLYNTTDQYITLKEGTKIGQLIFMDYSTDVEFSNKYNSFEEEFPSDRGTGGLGSTGN